VYARNRLYDELVSKVVVQRLRNFARPLELSMTYYVRSAVDDHRTTRVVSGHVDEAVSKGAKRGYSSVWKSGDTTRTVYEPTVLVDANKGCKGMREETWPTFAVMKVRDSPRRSREANRT